MKKSVAITTIVALHAAVIGMLLIQGCSSEPTAPQAGSAKASGEIVKEVQPNQEVVSEPKEAKIPEGSMVLRENPTRNVEKISNSNDVLVNEPSSENLGTAPKSDGMNEDLKPLEPKKPVAATLTTHAVKKGESLSSIAKKYKVSLNSLMKANNLNMQSKIDIGQELDIPSATGEVIPAPAKPAEVQPTAVPSEETSVYVVKKGDSLSRIAKNCHMTVAQLMVTNNLKSHNIRVGQKLQIVKGANADAIAKVDLAPAKSADSAAKPAKKAAAKVEAKEGEVSHTIANGETLGGLAKKYGTTVSAIADRNSIKDPRKIRVGQVIVIGGKKVAGEKAVAKTDVKKTDVAPAAPATPAASPILVTPEQPLKIEEPSVVQPKVEAPVVVPADNANPPIEEI